MKLRGGEWSVREREFSCRNGWLFTNFYIWFRFSHQNLNIILINLLNETTLIPLLWFKGLFEKSNLPWSFEIKELDALWKHIVTFRTQNFLLSPLKSSNLNWAPKNYLFWLSAILWYHTSMLTCQWYLFGDQKLNPSSHNILQQALHINLSGHFSLRTAWLVHFNTDCFVISSCFLEPSKKNQPW